MGNKTRLLMVLMGICSFLMLCACGGSLRSHFTWEDRKEVWSVKEWANAVELLEKDDLKINDFYLGKEQMTVWYTIEDNHTVLESFAEFVESSNQFLEENPDYFGTEDFTITMRCIGGGPTDEIVLSNRLIDDYFEFGELEPDIEDSNKLQYLYILIREGFYRGVRHENVKVDVPVLLLDRERLEIRDQEEFDLSFLDYFVNLEYIIINIEGDETYDYTVLKQRMEERVPDCEVYIMDDGEPLVKE